MWLFSEINIIETTERDSGEKRKILHDIFRKIFSEKRNSEEYYELFNSDYIDIKEFGKDALKLLTNYLTLENPKEIKALEDRGFPPYPPTPPVRNVSYRNH